MGAGLAKNKLSPETRRTNTPPRGGGVISVAPTPPPTLSSNPMRNAQIDHDSAPEDEFLEKIANNYMKRDRRSFHQGGTTYAGVDLRLEVDCVDNPAMEVIYSFTSHKFKLEISRTFMHLSPTIIHNLIMYYKKEMQITPFKKLHYHSADESKTQIAHYFFFLHLNLLTEQLKIK